MCGLSFLNFSELQVIHLSVITHCVKVKGTHCGVPLMILNANCGNEISIDDNTSHFQ